ncbi:hypothetical protein OTSSIDO_0579 [Orientia tsutsugamushi str. Sido]|nr:hypothetical protein OTSSIDO_0579 [Orientia tsutsugamushi str. Sido]
MKQYCIDLIQKIKYTFDLATAKIKDLADDLLCGKMISKKRNINY